MRRLKLFGLTLIAVFAATAVVTASASAVFALPQVLPALKPNWIGASVGTVVWEQAETLTKIECTSWTASGTTEASKTLGLFHMEFKGCKSPTVTCTGLGDANAGTILVLGLWHTVIDVDEPNLAAAILLLPEEFHLSCGIVLLKVRGSLLCLALEPLSLKATHEFHCTQKAGVPDEKTYLNDSGVLVEDTKLESSSSEGAFKSTGILMLGSMTYEETVKIDD